MGLFDIFSKKAPATTQYSDAAVKQVSGLLREVGTTRVTDLEKSILQGYNPDLFVQRKGFRTIDDMLLDDHVFAVLDMKKYFILGTGYQFILPEENSGDAKLKEILEFVKENFGDKYVGLFQSDLYQLLTAHEYGFSTAEKLYQEADGKYWLSRLKALPPHSIEFWTDDFGRLKYIGQRQSPSSTAPTVPGNPSFINLPVAKMLVYTHNNRFDNPYGLSDLQRCYKAWFIKDKVLRWWGIYLQRFASPFPLAKVPDSFNETQSAEILTLLNSIQQAVSLVVPKSAEVELVQTNGSAGGEYDLALDRLNQMVARALLVPDLLGFGSKIDGGSFALGEKHFEMFLNILNFERTSLETIINGQAVKQLVDINFGEQEVYPKFKFVPYDDNMLMDMMKLFLAAVDRGMPVNYKDYNQLRKRIKLPELSEQEYKALREEQLKLANINVNPNAQQRRTPGENPGGKATHDTITPGEQGKPEQPGKTSTKFSLDGDPDPFFACSKYEQRMDFKAIIADLDKREDDVIAPSALIFAKQREWLKDRIASRRIVTDGKYEEVEKLVLPYKGELKNLWAAAGKEVYHAYRRDAYKEIKKRVDEQRPDFVRAQDLHLAPNEAVGIAEKMIDAETFRAVGKLNDDLLNKAKNTIVSGIRNGSSEGDVSLQLDSLFNGLTRGSGAAGSSVEPHLLKTIVRTNNTNFVNIARRQVATSSANLSKFIWGYRYSAVMDGRTTDICIALNGKTYPKEDPVWNSISPPSHYNAILASSRIKTKEGEKLVEDVRVGDLVLTHTGKYQKVYDTMNKFEDKEYYILELDDGKVLQLTGEHPVLTKLGWVRADELTMSDDVVCVEDVS